MRVLYYAAADSPPEVRDIKHSLESMQSLVGGYLELIRLTSELDLYVNEEGRIHSLPDNRNIGGDWIVGPFFVVGREEGPDGVEERSLSDSEIHFLRGAIP